MNVVDSSCWLEYFVDSKLSESYRDVIEGDEPLLVPSITIYEVQKFMLTRGFIKESSRALEIMSLGHLVPLDLSLAVKAANTGVAFKLPLADSIIYSVAMEYSAILWTQDAHFKDLPSVKYFDKSNA